MQPPIADLLSRVRLGEPRCHEALAVFPLLLSEWPAEQPGYEVLDEALTAKHFNITEVSESGVVPMLRATNDGPLPVFLLDGEELVGARQNRVLNLSLLIPPGPGTTIDIPVSCVEAHRWAWRSRKFGSSGHAHYATGRASKLGSVSASLRARKQATSDQTQVWNDISAKAARMKVSSKTAAMSEIFDNHSSRLDAATAAFPPVEGQAGAVYFAGSRVIGVDLFDDPKTFSKLHRKLLHSYALDAIEEEQSTAAAAPAMDVAAAFLKSVSDSAEERFSAVGDGDTVRLSGREVVGAALETWGRCIHLAAFPAPAKRASRQAQDD